MPIDQHHLYGVILGIDPDEKTDTDRLEDLCEVVAAYDERLSGVTADIEALDEMLIATIDGEHGHATVASVEDWHAMLARIGGHVTVIRGALVDAQREAAA